MGGKPQLPDSIRRKIREMLARGHSQREVMRTLHVSGTTVRREQQPEWVPIEQARMREADQRLRPNRSQTPSRKAYQAAYADNDTYRENSRLRMAALRKKRRE